MTKPTKQHTALLAAALLTGSISLAGENVAKCCGGTTPVQAAPENNPLSFFNGRLVFDLQERLRLEVRENNFDFNDSLDSPTDDGWLLQRFRIGMQWKPCDWFKVYVQGQDSREIASDRPDFPGQLGAEGDDSFDLRQAYVEFGNARTFPLTLKLGRQLLSYGDERLIGSFDWNNIGRSFDAVKLRWEEKAWWLDAFASTVVVPTRGQYNQSDFANGNETGREQVFSGLYFSTSAVGPETIDLYALYFHENPNPKYQPAALGDTNFATLGLRVKSKPGAYAHASPAPASDGKSVADGKATPPPIAPKPVGLDYDLEAAFQTGEVRGLDLTAFAVHSGLGYTFNVPWSPRIGVEYNYASGDSNPADGNIETFQNLFPTNHKFYGFMDVFSWQNMHNPAISLKVEPTKKLSMQVDYHAFWLATNEDVWYRANGSTAVRPLTPRPAQVARAADKYAGSELDLTVTYKPLKQLTLQAGYSHFFAGSYLRDTGAHDDADFGYVQATLSF